MGLGAWIKGSLRSTPALRGGAVLAAAAVLSLASATARADDGATKRLTKYGKLAPAAASKVASAVSARMKRAADMVNSTDPLRMAVSQALFNAPVPADAMGSAKVRLRLYAGLNDWALDNVFSPKPGAIASCINSFQLQPSECEALVAAGGKTSVADASKRAGGAPANAAVAQQQQPAQGGYAAQRPAGGGYGYARPQYGQQQQGYAQPRPQYGYGQPQGGYRQPQQQGYAQPQAQYGYGARPQPQYGYGARPMTQPQYGARPMQPQIAAGPPPPSADVVASRKAEYERKRQEYLDRKKAEMEARKTKVVATAGGTDRVARGPTSEAEAEAAGLDKSAVVRAPAGPAKAGKAAGTKPAAASPADEGGFNDAPAEEPATEKPALDNDLLGDLLSDPLAKKK